MTVATDDEMLNWFRTPEGVKVEDQKPYYISPESVCVQLGNPESFESILHLSRAVALLSSEREEQFGGGRSLVGQLGFLKSITDRVGWKILEALRRSSDENRPIDVAPGHFFRSDELVQFCAALTCSLGFKWDAYVTTIGTDRFFISVKDCYLVMAIGDRESHDTLMRRLNRFGLTPVAPPKERAKLYCRTS